MHGDQITASPLRLALAGMIAMATAMGIGRFVYTPILPGMMTELGLTASDAGLVASANYLGYLLGAFAAGGVWAQRREREAGLAALWASGLLAFAMSATDDMIAFMLLRFLAGLASAFAMIFLTTVVFGRLADAGRETLQPLHFGGVGLGMAASSLMIAGLFTLDLGWRAGWIGAGALSILGAALAAAMLGPQKSERQLRPEPPLSKDPAFVRVAVGYGLFGFGYVVTATFLIAIVRADGGSRLFEASVWMVTGIAVIPSVFIGNWIADRLSMPLAFAIGCMVEALGVGASVALGGMAGPLIGGLLLGGTFIAITAIGIQLGRALSPRSPRRALAVMTVCFGIGQIIGPIVAGWISQASGSYLFASALAAAVLLVSGTVVLTARVAANSP